MRVLGVVALYVSVPVLIITICEKLWVYPLSPLQRVVRDVVKVARAMGEAFEGLKPALQEAVGVTSRMAEAITKAFSDLHFKV